MIDGAEAMDARRAKQLLLLCLGTLTTCVALVGGNHASARFCTR
ncbi:hypothetical protein AMTRI_Chr02g214560 [Amborella trichopoda]